MALWEAKRTKVILNVVRSHKKYSYVKKGKAVQEASTSRQSMSRNEQIDNKRIFSSKLITILILHIFLLLLVIIVVTPHVPHKG